MPIILINNSKWPERLLRDLLHHGARRVGARTDSVIVEVRNARWCSVYGRVSALDRDSQFMCLWLLHSSSRYPSGYRVFPYLRIAWAEASQILWVVYHEWQHVKDRQDGSVFLFPYYAKRTAWRERPEEQWAENTALRLMQNPTATDLALISRITELLSEEIW